MTLAYDRVGSGPPLVLLHGVGHRRQAWTAVVNLLRNRRELIMIDLPGHGESPPLELKGREPVQAMAEDVIAFFDELGLDRPHVAGNSLGGALALIAGSEGRAATVTGLSPAGFWVNRRQFSYAKAIFKIMEVTGAGIQRSAPGLPRYRAGRALMFASVVSRPSRLSPEQADADARAFTRARDAVNAIVDTPLWFTASIPDQVPVTIAWGTKDRLLLPSQAKVAQRQLPRARHLPLPGCGHVPMTDDPALVAQVLLDGSTLQTATEPATPKPAAAGPATPEPATPEPAAER
jgi:pimeloyl-ACP methyl ester carboxylesterase